MFKLCKLLSFYPRIYKVLTIATNFFYINVNLTEVLYSGPCATADCGWHQITIVRVGKVGCHSIFAYGKSGHVSPSENSAPTHFLLEVIIIRPSFSIKRTPAPLFEICPQNLPQISITCSI